MHALAHLRRSKVLEQAVKDLSELPLWNFDGSSPGQAPGHDSEVILKSVHAC